MSLTIGNKTQSNPNPNGANPYTAISHNHNQGTNGYLFLAIPMSNSQSFAQRMGAWYLKDPATGSNTVSVGFGGGQFNSISVYVCSIGNCQDLRSVTSALSATPHNENFTVSEGSWVFTTACSTQAISDIEIPVGDSRPAEYTHNTNRQVEGSLSVGSLTAGTYTIRTLCTSGTVSNDRTEFLEESGGGGGGNFFQLF